jgi:hypothetical protein
LQSIESLLNNFKESGFISPEPEFDENWLAEFIKAMRKKSELLIEDLNELLSKEKFMSELNEFLRVKILLNSPLRTISLKTYYFMQLASNTPIIHNIKLSENKSEILASRFFLQSSNVSNSNDEMIMLGALRKIAANSTIKVIVYNPFFPFIDLVRSSFCFLKILSENFYF